MTAIRDAALSCEAKFYALRKSKDGIIVSFVLHPNEVPDGLMLAEIGTRYMLALVEIGDDEQPVRKDGEANQQETTETANRADRSRQPDKTPPASDTDHPARAKSWHDMSPAQQAGMLCAYPAFINFLRAEYNSSIISKADAAVHVRSLCGVDSRADIDKSSAAQMRWRNLVSQYRAWMKEPEVV